MTNQPALALAVDFSKAFDTIRWDAMDIVLKKYNFGPKIRRMIATINTEIFCTVINNGKWQEWFSIKKGCRQGSPSSAILYILTVEVLGMRIRNNKEIRGINVFGENIKSCQYADDLWNVLFPEIQNIKNLLKELELFKSFSGQTVNFDKTKMFPIGPLDPKDFQFITKRTVQWTTEPVKILGIWVLPDKQIMQNKNFNSLLEKSRTILNSWKSRNLTCLGRICIVNTLVASLFAQKLAVLPLPSDSFFIEYKKIVLDFIWKGGAHQVKYSKIIQDYTEGGLKLTDLKSKALALKSKWPLYFKDREERWLYGPKLDHTMWQYNIRKQDISKLKHKLSFLGNLQDIWEA